MIAGRAPLPRLGATFRVQAVVALGDGTPMNVAFRPNDHGNWWENEQAAALAAEDVSGFGMRVRTSDLYGDRHRPAPLAGAGVGENPAACASPLSA